MDASLPKPYVEAAIEIANGEADFLTKDLVAAFKDVSDTNLQAEFAAVNSKAVGEFHKFATWLEKEKMPAAQARFDLGRESFEKMLRETELIDWPAQRVLALGEGELRHQQKVFDDSARLIDPNRKPAEVFKDIQREHPTAQTLLADTRKNLEAIRRFIVDHHIVTIPSEVRARVDETPAYMRAVCTAANDTPGPFETKATEAYYYVTPVEPDWTPQQKEGWLEMFNFFSMDVISIHEVYPGHYIQFLWLQVSHPSKVAKVFPSYAFVEGWAHYCEQMMLDEGFGRPETSQPTHDELVRAAKYRLAQSGEALLRLCRLCVAIRMHCDGMSLEEATRFFEQNCHYERKAAYAEARRGTFDPGYLFYTVGKLEFLKLRQDWEKQEGRNFSLERFHNELLQHGGPPLRLLRERMLKDPNSWDALF